MLNKTSQKGCSFSSVLLFDYVVFVLDMYHNNAMVLSKVHSRNFKYHCTFGKRLILLYHNLINVTNVPLYRRGTLQSSVNNTKTLFIYVKHSLYITVPESDIY